MKGHVTYVRVEDRPERWPAYAWCEYRTLCFQCDWQDKSRTERSAINLGKLHEYRAEHGRA